jgi:hypothetical protein
MLLMASESAADPIVEAYPFFSLLRKRPERATRQIDKLCTTVRALCNIVALIPRLTAEDVQDEVRDVQSAHVLKDALHAETLLSDREGGLQCTLYVKP